MRTATTVLTTAATALTALLMAAPSGAYPSFFTTWKNLYPGSLSGSNVESGVGTSCQLCHAYPSGGSSWNGYGWEMRSHLQLGLNLTQALLASEGSDSDLDPSGSSNLVEIQSDTQPGWTVGPNNTFYASDGSTLTNQVPPGAILGFLDPGQFSNSFCPGDGTGNGCPCLNEGDSGEGCANSTGSGALLEASGSASIAAADLVLESSKIAPGRTGLFFQGNNAINAGLGNAFGDGLRCVGGGLVRLQVLVADGAGASSTTVNVGAAGGVSAGQVKRYQYWYRDPVGSPCGNLFNLSNGLEVTWAP